MNLDKLKDAARKFEQKEDWRRAIEVYRKAIQEFESGQDPVPDVSIYNRVGDLYLKANDPAAAVQAYDRAVDLYTEQGFLNNAIALCGKILRVNPGRVQTYLKLAQLHARKNVVIEAKRYLIEFIERMHAQGRLDEAFNSVKAFAEQFPGNQEIRVMLIELLRAAARNEEAKEQLEILVAELEKRGDSAGARRTRERLEGIPEGEGAPTGEATRPKKSDLVFLDLGLGEPTGGPGRGRPAADLKDAAPAAVPGGAADGPSPLGLESAGPLDAAALDAPPIEGRTPDFADLRVEAVDVPMLPVEPTALGEGFGATGVPRLEGLERVGDVELDVPPVDGFEPLGPGADAGGGGDYESGSLVREDADLVAGGPVASPMAGLEQASGELILDPSGAAADAADLVERPLELDPFLDLGAAGEPIETTSTFTFERPEDAGPDGASGAPVAGLPLIEPTSPQGPSIAELEERILDDPDDPEAHRALGEALIALGETERGCDELDLALVGYEDREDWGRAMDLIHELIRLDPNVVRYHQKRVEVAYRTGEKPKLIDAYLELADALLRTGSLDKALAVYRRVLEHDPGNQRATAALETLAPPEPERPVVRAEPAAPPPQAPAGGGDFVDLGELVLGDRAPRDSRMRVEDEEPTGDEERDFAEMLEQFKRGIEEHIEAEDFQSHYDLGIAFKEMGLLDEAIAEFQKALRAPEGRLRTSEALGICFFEKGQWAIAEHILRRAVETQPGGEAEKVNLVYWLGRAAEAQGRADEAVTWYERAMAVDIRFRDVASRIQRLGAGRQG
ncbi:MAG TPA: tetratricopeptide repeat protein [Gemmatimonadales bacterium]|nr:tetratricopeptide repeat protein [Gemmatimonadales bacterium]